MNMLLRAARTLLAFVAWPIIAGLDRLNGVDPPARLATRLTWAREPVRTVHITNEDPYDDEESSR